MARGNALRITRQLLLLTLAAGILVSSWLAQSRANNWDEKLWVTVYPVLAGETAQTADFVADLSADDFDDISEFIEREAVRHGMASPSPVRIDLGLPTAIPPEPPADRRPLSTIFWSLKLRWWTWRTLGDQPGPSPDIRMFVVFHDLEYDVALPDSLGLAKALLGVAHVFGDRRYMSRNNVVIAHELLHTLGATDKYDASNNRPLYPHGFAEPDRRPRFPQRYAEIMGGRIPLSASESEMPESLKQARVGTATARELRWPGAQRSEAI